MDIDKDNKLFTECGIIETHIPSVENPKTRWDETYMRYTFLDGTEIVLQFGPISRMDQVDAFIELRDKILWDRIRWMKIKKIRELIYDTTK